MPTYIPPHLRGVNVPKTPLNSLSSPPSNTSKFSEPAFHSTVRPTTLSIPRDGTVEMPVGNKEDGEDLLSFDTEPEIISNARTQRWALLRQKLDSIPLERFIEGLDREDPPQNEATSSENGKLPASNYTSLSAVPTNTTPNFDWKVQQNQPSRTTSSSIQIATDWKDLEMMALRNASVAEDEDLMSFDEIGEGNCTVSENKLNPKAHVFMPSLAPTLNPTAKPFLPLESAFKVSQDLEPNTQPPENRPTDSEAVANIDPARYSASNSISPLDHSSVDHIGQGTAISSCSNVERKNRSSFDKEEETGAVDDAIFRANLIHLARRSATIRSCITSPEPSGMADISE